MANTLTKIGAKTDDPLWIFELIFPEILAKVLYGDPVCWGIPMYWVVGYYSTWCLANHWIILHLDSTMISFCFKSQYDFLYTMSGILNSRWAIFTCFFFPVFHRVSQQTKTGGPDGRRGSEVKGGVRLSKWIPRYRPGYQHHFWSPYSISGELETVWI